MGEEGLAARPDAGANMAVTSPGRLKAGMCPVCGYMKDDHVNSEKGDICYVKVRLWGNSGIKDDVVKFVNGRAAT